MKPWLLLVWGGVAVWLFSGVIPDAIGVGLSLIVVAAAIWVGRKTIYIPPGLDDSGIADTTRGLLVVTGSGKAEKRFVWTFQDWLGLVLVILVVYAIWKGVDPAVLFEKVTEFVEALSSDTKSTE